MKTYRELRDYKCGKGCDNGVFSVPFEYEGGGTTTKARLCECRQIKQNAYNIEQSGLAEVVDTLTLDTFTTVEPWQQGMKQKAEEYLKTLREDGHDWMMICGQVGCGKTHLATAVMRELLFSGHKALYTTWREIMHKLMATRFDRDDYHAEFGRLLKAEVLYIDDFLKGNTTDGDKNVAYDVIDARYKKNKATIITCEKTCKEIMELDSALGSRIYQKTKSFYIEISRDAKRNVRFVVE